MSNGNVKKITVLMNSDEYNRFSEYCKATGHKKSTLIVRLVKEHLDHEEFGSEDRRLPLFNVEEGGQGR